MLTRYEQLVPQLEKQLPPVIWISGDETLLVQEACDTIRQMAKEQGFSDREVHDAGLHFDWTLLLEASSSLSLFAERKLIDLRLHSPKLDNDGKKALQEFAADPGEDNLLLITSSRIEKPTLSTKWFKAIESKGMVVQVWPVSAQQLPNWVGQRMQRAGLKADRDSIDIICQRVEGNLLAAAQEIDKLSILTGDKPLTPEIVARAVADNSRFNVFALTDTSMSGNPGQALNILNHLRAEGDDPLKVLFFITREIRTLLRMQGRISMGENMNGVMQSERIWQNRMPIVGNALRRHTIDSLESLLLKAKKVDQSVKGIDDAKSWDELASMVMALSGTPTPLTPPSSAA